MTDHYIAAELADQYSLVETALMTKLRTLTTIFVKSTQVTDDDADVGTGADYWAVFQPGSFPGTRANGKQVDFQWEVIFDFYVRYKTRKESLPKFKAARWKLINTIHPNALNDTKGVSKVVLSASGGLQQDTAGDNPNFLIQTFSAVVTQRVSFDF